MRKAIMVAAAVVSISGQVLAQATIPAEIIQSLSVQGPAGGNVDTITTYLDRMTEAVVLFNTEKGYLLGTGSEFLETGVHYDATGPVKVTEVMAFFGPRAIVGTEDTIWAHFYSANSDSMPATELGSGYSWTGALTPQGYASYIPLTGAGYANGGFLISVSHPVDDTICVLSSKPSGDGMGERRTRQANFLHDWLRSYQYWTVNGSPYDGDALILPIIEFGAVGVPSMVTQNGLGIKPAFPQPAASEVTLPFLTNHVGTFALHVHDASGKLVHTQSSANLAPGPHAFQVRCQGLGSGTYHYTIAGPRAVLAGKFVVLN